MGIVSSGALYDVIRQNGLLSLDRQAEVPSLVHGRCGDARDLAKILLQRGWLTIYQANELLYGNGAELVIGPYHVLELLGRGGLSHVYKARHVEHDGTVALKVLRAEALSDELGRAQFLREMEAMALMDHPNIVQFCDVDQIGDTFFFAMEFVEGVDLGKHVSLSGRLSVAEACEYIRQASLGLQHAHEHNLVHRDVKPVNLFLMHVPIIDTGRLRPRQPIPTRPLVKLLDWGLADWRLPRGYAAAPATAALPAARGIIGTADYLAPEQARDASTVDIRGDIYSLGCTFYFLLTGQPPFPQGNLAQKLMLHQTAEPREIEEFREDVPAEVVRILKRMIAKQSEDRFQTPAAASMALKPFTKSNAPITQPLPVRAGTRLGSRKDDTPLPALLERIVNQAGELQAVRRKKD